VAFVIQKGRVESRIRGMEELGKNDAILARRRGEGWNEKHEGDQNLEGYENSHT